MSWFSRKYRGGKLVGSGMKTIAFLNQSNAPEITKPLLQKIASAVFAQLIEDYAPFWESAAPDKIVVCSALGEVPPDAAIMACLDVPDEPDALGYHWTTPQGMPVGRVFWNPVRDSGGTLLEGSNSLSAVFSHEVLEAIGDPFCNWWADVGNGEEDAIELCDRVEGDSYVKKGVAVSNFLGPRAFRQGVGPFDFMGKLASPFDLTPGGYAVRRKGGPTGSIRQIFGSHYPEHKKSAKLARKLSRMAKRIG